MPYAERSYADFADALTDLHRFIAQYVPAGAESAALEAALRRVEQSTLESAAIRAAFVDDNVDGVFALEPCNGEFRWLFINPAFARMTGMAADTVTGKPLSATPEAGNLPARCREIMSACAPCSFEERIERPDSKLELQTRLTPLYDSQGNCVEVLGVSRDVTEQRTAERLLRRQSRRLQNILSSISDGFIVVDRDWRITFVNSRAEKMLGSPRANLAGASLLDICPELCADRLRDSPDLVCLGSAEPDCCDAPPPRWITARAFPSQDGIAIYLQDVSDRKNAEQALKQGLERVQASLDGVVNAMAFAVEMRDPYTGGHQRRVSALACAIAREMGYPSEQVETLRIAGLLHDIGKISIPSEILNRPGKLSDAERVIVRTHAEIGYEILKEIEFDSPVALIALQHHERLDGSGYPHGLVADTIIPEARILAIADVVEAMASHRPYRAALGVESALKEVIGHRGVRYDGVAVDACLSVFTESGFDFDQLMQTEIARRHGEIEPAVERALP